MASLDGRVAIITGAGRGIGRQHALLFAREGACVVVNDRRGAHDVVAEITASGGRAVANTDNVADWAAAQSMVSQAVAEFGSLDIVVNHAGVLRDGFVAGLDEAQWDADVAAHLKGHFALVRHAAEYWKQQATSGATVRASVINTASPSGTFIVNPGQANQAAANAGIAAMTLVAAAELARYGVRVNAITPTEGDDGTQGPEEVSALVAHLAERRCTLTGRVLSVAGGEISELAGWHVLRTIEAEETWTVDSVADGLLAWT